ncbi:hypothetical protein K502DRAFT_346110 [Neoconidiobolus thromboides FSU 785]|nr:hypothetical protein K502DRAFT_346110 [Neoconidiobolus thromboides FSU 785]
MLIFYLTLLFFFNRYLTQTIPKLSGGNCMLIEDKIYYLGGSIQDNDNKPTPNKNVYMLNLADENFMINNNQAKWIKINNNGPPSMYGNIVQSSNHSKEIYMIGGEGSNISQGFQVYNIDTNKWNTDEVASKGLSDILKKELNTVLPLTNTYTIKVDNKNIFYFGGKYTNKDKKLAYNEKIFYYNIDRGTWEVEKSSYKTSIDGGIFYLKLAISNFGGKTSDNKYQDNKSYNAWLIDTKSSNINTIGGNNSIPTISKFSTVTDNNNEFAYILGGTDNKNGNSIYKLMTSTIKVDEPFEVEGLESYDNGCLVYYQDYLIYSFGSKNNKYSDKTQLIQLNEKKLSDKLNKKTTPAEEDERDKGDNGTAMNIGAVVGGSVGGFIVIVVIFGSIFYFYFKKNKKKKQEELKPPEYIKEVVWAGQNNRQIEIEFVDSFGTQVTYIDDDVTDPENVPYFLTESDCLIGVKVNK